MRVEGFSHNLFTVLLLLGAADLAHRPRRAAVVHPRRGRSGRVVLVSVIDVPRHEPRLPGRRRPGGRSSTRPGRSTSCSSSARCSRSTPGSPGSGSGWAGRDRSPGSGRRSAIFGSLLFSVALLPSFGAGSREHRATLRGARPAGWPRRASARRERRPGHHRLPDLAGRDAARPRPGPARRTAARRPRPGDDRVRRRHARHPDRADEHGTGRPSSTPACPGAECFRRARPRRPAPRRLGRRARRTFACSRSSAHEWRPVYSEAAWSQHAPGPSVRDSRFDGLHAEAKAAVGYSANTLRSVRERYREAYPRARRAGRHCATSSTSIDRGADRRAPARAIEHGAGRPRGRRRRGRRRRRPAAGPPRRRRHARPSSSASTRPSSPSSSSPSATSSDVALPRARRREPRRPRSADRPPRAMSRCASSRPRRPSARGSPRRSTTGRPRPSSNAIFQVEYIERVIESDPLLARTELRFLRELLRRELGDVRAFISQLRPPVLDELGLDGAIARHRRAHADADRPRRSRPTWPLRPTASTDGPADGRPAGRPGGAAECPQARGGDIGHRGDAASTATTGSSRSATTVAGSTSERWRPAAGATSGSNSCASEPS